MRGYYILDAAGQPVRCDNVRTWGQWFETAGNRQIARTVLHEANRTPITVSTVFLGLDHNHEPSGPPVLWETMVFGGNLDQEGDRYSSADDAQAGHEQWVAKAGAAHPHAVIVRNATNEEQRAALDVASTPPVGET